MTARPSAEPVARVRIFLAEKRHHHSHRAGRPRQPATAAGGLYRDQSAAAVVRDDGAVLTESVAVCRYFEALHLDPPLFGRDARESALIEMWNRRVLYIRVSTVFQHFAFGHEGDGRSA